MDGEMEQVKDEVVTHKSPVNNEFVKKLTKTLIDYTKGRKALEERIVENEKWFKSRHWDLFRGKEKNANDPEPSTSYLFSTIASKHADAMDYYPEPNLLAREQDDVEESNSLSKIVPVVLDKNNYRKTYSDAWWYKLKQGASLTGVFWNPDLENGLGDIHIKKIDILNVFWEPGITDIQESPYLFVVSLVDNDIIKRVYPQAEDSVSTGASTGGIDIKEYSTDDTVDVTNKSMIVDCYYKRRNKEGRTVLHLTKFIGDMPLGSTEDDPQTAESGLYDHGMYPLVPDVLFPDEKVLTGFGYIDIIKNPQMYIDKLDQIIVRNSLIAGKQRTFVGSGFMVNEAELADLSKDIVHFEGKLENNTYHVEQGRPLPGFVVQHRQNKIAELKDTANNNDFSRGDTGGGVTAASAIAMLQEAGNKTSRDMIAESYNSYTQLIYMVVELIRQFYDEPRQFRITNEAGSEKFVSYSNEKLKPQEIPKAYDGEGMTSDPDTGEPVEDPEYKAKYRMPVFDIKVKPEKASPYSRIAQNEMAKELYSLGFFNPQREVEAKLAMEMMSFEGKDKIYKLISENGDMAQQLQQMQMQMQQMQTQLMHLQNVGQENAELQQMVDGMNKVIKNTTGRDLMAPAEQTPGGQEIPPEQGGMQG